MTQDRGVAPVERIGGWGPAETGDERAIELGSVELRIGGNPAQAQVEPIVEQVLVVGEFLQAESRAVPREDAGIEPRAARISEEGLSLQIVDEEVNGAAGDSRDALHVEIETKGGISLVECD